MARSDDDVAMEETVAAPAAATSPDGPSDLGSLASALGALAATPAGGLARGALVDDQYRIVGVIGEGGMGVVYRARDVRLDRDVAIKVGTASSAASLARAGREAIALARLSHPNVVVVYQVGEVAGHIYIAMELVPGGNARQWLKERPRSWREVVALYAAAGDGLAAAHATGLVHRDFKPDNVLVGADGRPRVADFGLAREIGERVITPDGDRTPSDAITQTGAVLGTPAYMAPEQLAGEAVDARADQFAFCVALWDALFGARPFPGRTPAQLALDIEAGPRAPASDAARRVPRRVIAALQRGLRDARDQRWPAMEPLLAELRRDPAARRRRVAIAGTAGVIATVAVAVAWSRGGAPDLCAGGDARIAATWNPSRAREIGARLRAMPRTWAARSADVMTATLDGWARRWAVQYRAVCEAGGAAWSRELRDRGVRCLARRQDELVAAIGVLQTLDAAEATNAGAIVRGIGAPEACTDPVALGGAYERPDDPRVAAAVERLEGGIRRAMVLEQAGRTAEAMATINPLVSAADAIGFGPTIAIAHGERSAILRSLGVNEGANQDARLAALAALASGDDLTATRNAANVSLGLLELSKDEAAADWSSLADAIATRSKAVAHVRSAVLSTRAAVAVDRGDPARGLALAEDAVRLARVQSTTVDGDAVDVLITALLERANAHKALSQFQAAIDDYGAAIAAIEHQWGKGYPNTIDLLDARAFVLGAVGRPEEAIADARAALVVAEANYAADSNPVAEASNALATALGDGGHNAEAVAMFDRVLPTLIATEGEQAFNVASAYNNRGLALDTMGRYDDAIASHRRAIEIWSATVGPDAADVAAAYGGVAEAEQHAHRPAEALIAASAARAIYEKRDPKDPALGYPLTTSGAARASTGDLRGARVDLERALALRTSSDTAPFLRAYTEVHLAMVLDALGERDRARALGRDALAIFRETGNHPPAETKAFLDTLR